MSPAAIETAIASEVTNGVKNSPVSALREPLKYSGSLDEYGSFNVTNIVGKEFPTLQLSSIVHNDNKVRDLAILGTSLILVLETVY